MYTRSQRVYGCAFLCNVLPSRATDTLHCRIVTRNCGCRYSSMLRIKCFGSSKYRSSLQARRVLSGLEPADRHFACWLLSCRRRRRRGREQQQIKRRTLQCTKPDEGFQDTPPNCLSTLNAIRPQDAKPPAASMLPIPGLLRWEPDPHPFRASEAAAGAVPAGSTGP